MIEELLNLKRYSNANGKMVSFEVVLQMVLTERVVQKRQNFKFISHFPTATLNSRSEQKLTERGPKRVVVKRPRKQSSNM